MEGAKVGSFSLKGAEVTIPIVIVGEEGRGRSLGITPVQLSSENYDLWKAGEQVFLQSALVGETRAGNPKLIESSEDREDECIIVFRTKIGFRGGNSHTGDRSGQYRVHNRWHPNHKAGLSQKEAQEYCQEKEIHFDNISPDGFFPFPGKHLVEGSIAQGAAGRAGSGMQYISVIPEGVVFRTGYRGRLYGNPSAHYYIFQDGQILAATWEERGLTDLF